MQNCGHFCWTFRRSLIQVEINWKDLLWIRPYLSPTIPASLFLISSIYVVKGNHHFRTSLAGNPPKTWKIIMQWNMLLYAKHLKQNCIIRIYRNRISNNKLVLAVINKAAAGRLKFWLLEINGQNGNDISILSVLKL